MLSEDHIRPNTTWHIKREKCMSRRLGEPHLGAKCLFQKGERREVCPLHTSSRFCCQTPQPWVGLYQSSPSSSVSSLLPFTSVYTSRYLRDSQALKVTRASGRHPSVSLSDPCKEDSVSLTSYHSLCTHLALLSITLRTFLLKFTITLSNSHLRKPD